MCLQLCIYLYLLYAHGLRSLLEFCNKLTYIYPALPGTWVSISQCHAPSVSYIPYLPYIFGRIKIIIFFTVRTFNLEKYYKFFSVRIFMNAEKLPIIEGIHRYICGNFNVYTDRCENKQFVYITICCFIN